jgi:hypothetical protein
MVFSWLSFRIFEFASSDVLDLCTKYLIGMFNYTQIAHLITLPLFYAEQNISSRILKGFTFSIVIILVLSSLKQKVYDISSIYVLSFMQNEGPEGFGRDLQIGDTISRIKLFYTTILVIDCYAGDEVG